MTLSEFWQFEFIRRALIAGILLAISASLLGLYLLLRKMAMLGDGIAHISFGAIAFGLFLNIFPLFAALPLVTLATLFILRLSQRARIFSDTAIAIVSSIGLAGGVLIASLARGFNIELMSYLFGSILTVTGEELWLAVVLCLIVILFVRFFYWKLFVITFDVEHARTLFPTVDRLTAMLTVLTALTIVLMIRLAGALLVSALLVLPAAGALQLSQKFRQTVWLTVVLATLSLVGGLLLAINADLPPGATIVLFNFSLFLLMLLLKKLGLQL